MRKTCSRCKIEKNLENFHWKNKKEKIRQSHCSACSHTYGRSHYLKNKNQYLEKSKRNRKKTQLLLWNYLLKHPCVDCGEKDPVVLDFDHIKGTKINNLSSLADKSAIVNTYS